MAIELLTAGESRSTTQALAELDAGRPLVIPTETVYGLLGSATHADSVALLRAVPVPPATAGPLALHLGRGYPLADLVGPASALFRRLARKAWPGPLSIILEQPAQAFGPLLAALPPEVRSQVVAPLPDGYLAVQLRCPQPAWTSGLLDLAHAARLGPMVAVGLADRGEPAVTAHDARVALDRRLIELGRVGACRLAVDGGRARFARPSTVVRVRGESWSLVRAGVWDERTIRRFTRFSLLFVCSGNTCRSPMAGALARRALAERLGVGVQDLEARGVEVHTAGVGAADGAPASPEAVQVMRRRGLDLSAHRSHGLTHELVQASDLVLAMTAGHREAVLAMVPSAADKVRLLGPRPVIDPFGGGVEEYEETAGQLEDHVTRLVKELDL